MMRLYILVMGALYFGLWGYYSNWSLHEMLFWENDIRGTMTRIAAGFVVLVMVAFALMEAHPNKS